MVKVCCDRCDVILSKTGDYEDTDIEINEYLKTVDLCESCFKELVNVIECFFERREKREDTK